jgi:hypothetical protein
MGAGFLLALPLEFPFLPRKDESRDDQATQELTTEMSGAVGRAQGVQ